MIKLKKSDALQRDIRQDDPSDLKIPTWTLIRDAIKSRKHDEALRYLDYCEGEAKRNNDSLAFSAGTAYTYIANFGEQEIEKLFRKRFEPIIRQWLSMTPGVEETLQRSCEFQRGHHGNIAEITEDSEKFVVKLDPCGTGGMLRRNHNLGVTKKKYPWSWSKSNIPYYCTHCCIMWEIIPIEQRGFPLRIVEVGNKPEDPCVLLFYKNPESIPEKYFTRVGKKIINK